MIAAFLAVAAGCGGDGAPTRAQFVAQANDACAQEREGLAERVAKFEDAREGRRPQPYGDMVHFVLLPTVEEELRNIRELERPEGEEDAIAAVLSGQESAVNEVATTRRISLSATERRFAAAEGLESYGLERCVVRADALGLEGE